MWVNLSADEWKEVKLALSYWNNVGKKIVSTITKRQLEEYDTDYKYFQEEASASHHKDGEIEFDDDCVVSMGADNGAYVMGWVWVEDRRKQTDEEQQTIEELE